MPGPVSGMVKVAGSKTRSSVLIVENRPFLSVPVNDPNAEPVLAEPTSGVSWWTVSVNWIPSNESAQSLSVEVTENDPKLAVPPVALLAYDASVVVLERGSGAEVERGLADRQETVVLLVTGREVKAEAAAGGPGTVAVAETLEQVERALMVDR